jgi:hypothetical protein
MNMEGKGRTDEVLSVRYRGRFMYKYCKRLQFLEYRFAVVTTKGFNMTFILQREQQGNSHG